MTYLLTEWRMSTTEKTCFKCKAVKPITEFYVHPAMGDGRLGKCKECTKADVRANYTANQEYYRNYERSRRGLPHRVEARKEYAATDAGRSAARRGHANYQARHPERRAAHVWTGNALCSGRLSRQPCEKCGDHAAEAHHDDYSRPDAVRWLCKRHHVEHHNERRG